MQIIYTCVHRDGHLFVLRYLDTQCGRLLAECALNDLAARSDTVFTWKDAEGALESIKELN